MESRTTRLDRYLRNGKGIGKNQTKALLAQGRISIDGEIARSAQQQVNQFTRVEIDGNTVQDAEAVYIALNKPKGVVSATVDAKHPTALQLIDHPLAAELHIAGRLDKNSTGLLLLTNDGAWSRALSSPSSKVEKTYQVKVENPLTEAMARAFAEGIYFPTEDLTTLPASLIITAERSATVVLSEGKYHQIKRMFGRFRNPVLEIHRVQIGQLKLTDCLGDKRWKQLDAEELALLGAAHHATPKNV